MLALLSVLLVCLPHQSSLVARCSRVTHSISNTIFGVPTYLLSWSTSRYSLSVISYQGPSACCWDYCCCYKSWQSMRLNHDWTHTYIGSIDGRKQHRSIQRTSGRTDAGYAPVNVVIVCVIVYDDSGSLSSSVQLVSSGLSVMSFRDGNRSKWWNVIVMPHKIQKMMSTLCLVYMVYCMV